MRGIVLDTNVVSEPRRRRPDPKVRAWFEAQAVDTLFLTATVIGELSAGIERMPAGRRRADFEGWLKELVEADFAGRILAFDAAAAVIFGKVVAEAMAQGRPPAMGDAQIVAVARRDGLAVATRDVADFQHLGATIVDPWRGP